MTDLLKLLEKNAIQEGENDDDKQFLLSLLPTLKKFDEFDKLMVRVEIMNIIKRQLTYKWMYPLLSSVLSSHSYLPDEYRNACKLYEIHFDTETTTATFLWLRQKFRSCARISVCRLKP
ncbi:hypothetical protein PR048_010249 [Dryococelus australis]|uniref:BESS domain-containing protein n=1 Tax=Dryococelus australis TaxID=614101 RepID=A0ABQ9I3B0_9NEOP|nr:hypothetical protein PR048_010249 [Dryococelus australis]